MTVHHREADRLLTRAAVAALLGIHKSTVQRAERTGKLAAIKLGARLTRYELAEVERWKRESTYRRKV